MRVSLPTSRARSGGFAFYDVKKGDVVVRYSDALSDESRQRGPRGGRRVLWRRRPGESAFIVAGFLHGHTVSLVYVDPTTGRCVLDIANVQSLVPIGEAHRIPQCGYPAGTIVKPHLRATTPLLRWEREAIRLTQKVLPGLRHALLASIGAQSPEAVLDVRRQDIAVVEARLVKLDHLMSIYRSG